MSQFLFEPQSLLMPSKNYSRSTEFYKNLPKVDLHRHLEGSLRVRTMMEIVRSHDMDIEDTGYLRPLVQMDHNEPYTFENFLSKFGTLQLFYRSPQIIKRITLEAIEDAALDNVRYLELRFTPISLSKAGDFSIDQVIDWVARSAQEAEERFGILVRLIISVNRHGNIEEAQKAIKLAADYGGDRVVGIDLAGNEAEFSAEPFKSAFLLAKEAGLRLTVHAGEWGKAENVREAIIKLGAERIGHGVRVLDNPSVVNLARERGTTFEVCVTSNHHSGVISDLEKHPLAEMILNGLNVTINTDDPSISRITLSNEYQVVTEQLGIPLSVLRERILASVQAAFLPTKEKNCLLQQISSEFAKKMLQMD
ncbi:MAG: adenosine deaminase [Anaerolineaceae bacterium 4572_5.2]|nr:MAG: adenosine deaminase [Anaerolineaceae bacterium 4572_5.2]